MIDQCYLATLAFENHEWIPALVEKFPDLVIYDCSEKNPYRGPGNVIKIPNEGFTGNWNYVFDEFLKTDKEYIWMTNNDIEIGRKTVEKLLERLSDLENAAGIVASYNSHHQPLRNHETGGLRKVPFLEQTSPIYKRKAISDLKDKFGYVLYQPIKMGWGVDIISSYELRKLGYDLYVDDSLSFHHYIAGNAKVVYGSKKNYTKTASEDRGKHIAEYIGRGWKKKMLEGFEHLNYKI
jgi:hypothetical protein